MGKPPPNFAMPQHSSAITADIQTRLKLKASSSILVWPAAKSSDLCSVWRMMPITFSFALGQYVVESTAIARPWQTERLKQHRPWQPRRNEDTQKTPDLL